MKVTLRELIDSACRSSNADPEFMASIIYCESGGNKWATRYEPEFYDKYLANKTRETLSGFVPDDLPNLTTEKRERATSFGLAQLLGETLRSRLHFNHDFLAEALDPELNVLMCATFLATLNEEYSWIPDLDQRIMAVVRRYNGKGQRAREYQEKVYRVRECRVFETILDKAL